MADKAVRIAGRSLTGLTVVVLLIAGWQLLTAPARGKADAGNLRLAISILRRPPAEAPPEVRRWAVDTLGRLSDTPLGDEARRELMAFRLPGGPHQVRSRDADADCRGGRAELQNPWLFHQELWTKEPQPPQG